REPRRQAVELECAKMLVDPVLFLERDEDDDVFLGMPRQAVKDLQPILEMLDGVRAIYDVGDFACLAEGVDVDELEARVKGACQAETDLGNVAAADRRKRKGALQDRQRIAQSTAVIENRVFASAHFFDEPVGQFTAG